MGTTTNSSNYEFKDNQPFDGKNYYRLKQIDQSTGVFDTKYEYSNIINITIEESNSQTIDVFPNPATGNFINIHIENENATISLLDNTGKTIQNIQLINGTSQMDISNLPSGLYYISIMTNGVQGVKKIIVK